MKLVLTWLCNAAAIAVAAWIFSGISIGDAGQDGWEKAGALLIVAAVFTAINLTVGRLLKLVSIPFIVLTLGILLLVLNALLLRFTAWVTDALPVLVEFHVDGFWVALWGSIVISLVNMALRLFIDAD
ncbi:MULTISPECIES: phage holin family protein [Mumia]|uniref:phage holin family protein n=1 Tax=Mumia TaxID=1546255 RepID=UPI00142471BB|nr:MULTISPECIES: phage holin family protein [unclassified Mumia]QMW66150.1 phage holin family protein [Mumia sp. ZJ1417]